MWDVCQSCVRPGSLDLNIKNEAPNKVHNMCQQYPSLKSIIFNGKKSEQLYNKYFDKIKGIDYFTCLSTSPANAAYSFEEKLKNWKLALFK